MEEIQGKHILCPRVACWAPHPPMFRKVFWPNLIAQSLLGLGCKPCHLPSRQLQDLCSGLHCLGHIEGSTFAWWHVVAAVAGGLADNSGTAWHHLYWSLMIERSCPLRCNASGDTFKGLTRTEYQNDYPNSGAVGPLCLWFGSHKQAGLNHFEESQHGSLAFAPSSLRAENPSAGICMTTSETATWHHATTIPSIFPSSHLLQEPSWQPCHSWHDWQWRRRAPIVPAERRPWSYSKRMQSETPSDFYWKFFWDQKSIMNMVKNQSQTSCRRPYKISKYIEIMCRIFSYSKDIPNSNRAQLRTSLVYTCAP